MDAKQSEEEYSFSLIYYVLEVEDSIVEWHVLLVKYRELAVLQKSILVIYIQMLGKNIHMYIAYILHKLNGYMISIMH